MVSGFIRLTGFHMLYLNWVFVCQLHVCFPHTVNNIHYCFAKGPVWERWVYFTLNFFFFFLAGGASLENNWTAYIQTNQHLANDHPPFILKFLLRCTNTWEKKSAIEYAHVPTHARTDSALGVAAKRATLMTGHVLFVCGRSFPMAACKLHNGNLWACFHLGESH